MSLIDAVHGIISKLYRLPGMKWLKDEVGVPLRHAIFGKKDFYKVLDIVKEFELNREQEVKIVFDVGASIGDKAYVLARAFPKAKIYCFEPYPIIFKQLKKRMERFGDRVLCFNFGFYNTNGEVDFYTAGDPYKNPSSTGTSSFIATNGKEMTRAKARRLDDFIKEAGIKRIDFMKVDVEASEKEMIEGGEEALRKTDNLFIEIVPMRRGFNSHEYLDVIENLHKLGFSLFGVYEDFFFTKMPSDV